MEYYDLEASYSYLLLFIVGVSSTYLFRGIESVVIASNEFDIWDCECVWIEAD
jgi:hypothetical protein